MKELRVKINTGEIHDAMFLLKKLGYKEDSELENLLIITDADGLYEIIAVGDEVDIYNDLITIKDLGKMVKQEPKEVNLYTPKEDVYYGFVTEQHKGMILRCANIRVFVHNTEDELCAMTSEASLVDDITTLIKTGSKVYEFKNSSDLLTWLNE